MKDWLFDIANIHEEDAWWEKLFDFAYAAGTAVFWVGIGGLGLLAFAVLVLDPLFPNFNLP